MTDLRFLQFSLVDDQWFGLSNTLALARPPFLEDMEFTIYLGRLFPPNRAGSLNTDLRRFIRRFCRRIRPLVEASHFQSIHFRFGVSEQAYHNMPPNHPINRLWFAEMVEALTDLLEDALDDVYVVCQTEDNVGRYLDPDSESPYRKRWWDEVRTGQLDAIARQQRADREEAQRRGGEAWAVWEEASKSDSGTDTEEDGDA